MFQIKKRNFIVIVLIVFLLGGTITGGMLFALQEKFGEYVKVPRTDYEKLIYSYEKYAKLGQLEEAIKGNYYKDVKEHDLEVGVYKGLFWGLDDVYSSYLTKDEYETMKIYTTGEFQGIGVTISADKSGRIVVISTIDGSPAEKAGLKTGDYITKVDGVSYGADKLDIAASMMRGKPGTKVDVVYVRNGKEHEVTLSRANLVKESVEAKMLEDNLGYIRISQFEKNTDEDFEKELRNFELKGAKGLIIDLRNNGGGIVESGANIADLLLPEGNITYLQDRNGKKEYINSESNCTNIPYVILVNGGTASTSEIVSAAVKDHKSGILVGTTTFGKGVVQSITPLKDGDAIKLTVMQYFSPDGNVIQEKGVLPDFVVDLIEDDLTDYQLNKAIELLK